MGGLGADEPASVTCTYSDWLFLLIVIMIKASQAAAASRGAPARKQLLEVPALQLADFKHCSVFKHE